MRLDAYLKGPLQMMKRPFANPHNDVVQTFPLKRLDDRVRVLTIKSYQQPRGKVPVNSTSFGQAALRLGKKASVEQSHPPCFAPKATLRSDLIVSL
jgi:hypothetical protein